MAKDDPKALILARRARFVAAALAGVTGVATACTGGADETGSSQNPEPCLGIQADATSNPPQPCLSAPYTPPDAGDAGDAGDATDGESDADAEPQPCLTPLPGDQ